MVVTKDRTNELHQIFEEMKRQGPPKGPPPTARQQTSQFYEAAQEVTKELTATSEMLSNLTRLIQERNVFDDHSQEIQTMSVMVKERISGLNRQLGILQQIRDQQKQWGAHQANDHSNKVVSSLRQQMLGTAKRFKEVLTSRTKTMKAANDRRSNFTFDAGATFGSSLFRHADDEPMMAGPGAERQQLVPRGNSTSYYRQRQEGVRQIEQTVAELGDMFAEFSRLVAEQEEMVTRIDANVDSALVDVERGQTELLKYLNRISSNRWLILKIFGVLFVFVIIFGLFVVN